MGEQFLGKVAVIIGGNSGIGLASAKAFASEGARVVITGRDSDTLRAAAGEIGHGAVSYRSDIGDLAQIEALFAQLRTDPGRIDVLFVNAGIGAFLPIEAVTEADWDRIQDIVSPGPVETPIIYRTGGLPPEAVPAMREQMIANTPMKRMGAPEEVAAAVLFLASDAAGFVTGIDFLVDGGVASF